MSKQVVVTDRDGNTSAYEGVKSVEVISSVLWLFDDKGKAVAVIRDWAGAKRVGDESKPSADVKPARGITVDLEANVKAFQRALAQKPVCTRLCCCTVPHPVNPPVQGDN